MINLTWEDIGEHLNKGDLEEWLKEERAKDKARQLKSQTEPVGCSKGWSSKCTSCERYFSCDYLSGRHTDCGWVKPNE